MRRSGVGIHRRDLLRVGALGGLGLGLGDLLRLEASAPANARGKNAIFIFLTGGQSHIDTWDLKPDAATEYRGEFKPIPTNLPGLQVCEHMPRLAEQADKYTLLRSVTHNQGAHGQGQRLLQTGNRQNPALEYPDYGAVVARERTSPRGIPPYVLFPSMGSNAAVTSAGYLGVAYGPFTALGDPNAKDFSVRALATPGGITADQFEARMKLLGKVDTAFRGADLASPDLEGMDRAYQQAFEILQSPAVRQAFEIQREPDAVRDRYGRTTFGQSCLLARRLVEAGSRCVAVYHGGWDTHQYNFRDLKNTLLPAWDAGLAALLADLHTRGLLASTVVWCTGEFGRTPKINNTYAGRDHWPRAMSMLLAGAGIRGGQVIGKTDPTASEPVEAPLRPEDVSASFYHALGIDHLKEYHTPDGRPVYLVREGKPIRALWE
jgi:uncharacterized protein (DUF1501 family)